MSRQRQLSNEEKQSIKVDTLGKLLGMFEPQDRTDLARQQLGLEQQRALQQQQLGMANLDVNKQEVGLRQKALEQQGQLAAEDREARKAGSNAANINAKANLLQLGLGQQPGSPILQAMGVIDPQIGQALANPANSEFGQQIMQGMADMKAKKTVPKDQKGFIETLLGWLPSGDSRSGVDSGKAIY